MPTKLLGYGIFSSATWDKKNWQFERLVGIQPTSKEAWDKARSVITHCLHKEHRRIYSATKLNIGHHRKTSARFVLASELEKE